MTSSPKRSGPADGRFFERFEVPSVLAPQENHFVRWRVVQTPWAALYVHRLDNPDVRTLHDHPWSFVSFVVRGGYWERREHGGPLHHVRRFNRKRATDLHYIERLDRHPTWTVVLTGRRVRDWGYLDPDGTWTRLDLHPNARKFDAAVAARAQGAQ